MSFYYFVPVPELAADVREKNAGVELVAWLVSEGAAVRRDDPIARVQTRWAVLELLAASDGVLGKQIFGPGTHVREGDPLAVMYADGESLPYNRPSVGVRVTMVRQLRPKKSKADSGVDPTA